MRSRVRALRELHEGKGSEEHVETERLSDVSVVKAMLKFSINTI